MNNIIKANIVSLFLSLDAEGRKKVLAELKALAQKDQPKEGKNISEEKL